MKKIGSVIQFAFGCGLVVILVWGLGAQVSSAAAAKFAQVLNAPGVDGEPRMAGTGFGLGAGEDWPAGPTEPTPHPILSELRVRRAIAYCTDKDALIAAAYPALTPAERQELIMDTVILKTSWAYTPPSIIYPYNPTLGQGLLDEAGWILPTGGDYRLKNGKELFLQLNTTDNPLRMIFLPIFEDQMKTCGIHVIRNHQPTSWFIGRYTGLQVRDFELGEYAWILADDPDGAEGYACDRIPSPANDWSGQNFMGWCNQAASDAIVQASNPALPQDQRKALYATFINLFAVDVPSLPLFVRSEARPSNISISTWKHMPRMARYRQRGPVIRD